MIDLAQAMLDEAIFGKSGTPADLVIVVDDVELGNLTRQKIVADHFKAAVETVLSGNRNSSRTEERYRDVLRNKCSFHLFDPMIETYFFGDALALTNAGVDGVSVPLLAHASDVERFEVNDPVWLPVCLQENLKRQEKAPWWRHELHPKLYLQHLIERTRSELPYKESRDGSRALSALEWPSVPKVQADTPMVRCLFQDISDGLGIPNPIGVGALNPDFYAGMGPFLLRNI
jgi:hypothetical protein